MWVPVSQCFLWSLPLQPCGVSAEERLVERPPCASVARFAAVRVRVGFVPERSGGLNGVQVASRQDPMHVRKD